MDGRLVHREVWDKECSSSVPGRAALEAWCVFLKVAAMAEVRGLCWLSVLSWPEARGGDASTAVGFQSPACGGLRGDHGHLWFWTDSLCLRLDRTVFKLMGLGHVNSLALAGSA